MCPRACLLRPPTRHIIRKKTSDSAGAYTHNLTSKRAGVARKDGILLTFKQIFKKLLGNSKLISHKILKRGGKLKYVKIVNKDLRKLRELSRIFYFFLFSFSKEISRKILKTRGEHFERNGMRLNFKNIGG